MSDMKIKVILEEVNVNKDFFTSNRKENNLKCPFCQQELRKIHPTYVICDNCRITGEDKLWQELIRTRKALDVAINAMKSAGTHNSINCIARGEDPSKDDVGITINHALAEITALEQKDVK